ncbi:MAG: hypothetical protein VB075_19400 [Petrimonas sp.]|uniref:hypothetical protein n=1 Tax=Petrimonas sp. TaxID=2023866 RepID=UPI002B3D9CAB|nr:hypothetical protein [Petrimonas sp.]MEA5046718.1 hypothetical protein [Petrimonas sp.]
MNYKLDNIPLSSLGAIPSRGNQFFALEGMLDLPKRIGTTEYNWGTSIEPFVDTEDIELDGRALTLNVAIKKTSLDTFKSACVACTELSFDYDTFQVVQKDEIKVEEIGGYYKVEIPFWQNSVGLKPITITPSGTGFFKINNFDLAKDFGIYLAQSSNSQNTAKRIEVQTTEFYERTNFRDTWIIDLPCSLVGNDFSDMYAKMSQFQALMMSPGIHALKIRNNTLSIYFKDGMSVNVVSENIAQFTLRATVV